MYYIFYFVKKQTYTYKNNNSNGIKKITITFDIILKIIKYINVPKHYFFYYLLPKNVDV